jgi:hypothetical protein
MSCLNRLIVFLILFHGNPERMQNLKADCGTEEEDQLHLYRCTDKRMQECMATNIASLNSKLVKEGIITPVYTAFTNSICMAANRPPLSNYKIENERALQ